jgi:hypothetical protein
VRSIDYKRAKNYIKENYTLPSEDDFKTMIKEYLTEAVDDAIRRLDVENIVRRTVSKELDDKIKSLARSAELSFREQIGSMVRDRLMNKLDVKLSILEDKKNV